jgi:hypothetical protein
MKFARSVLCAALALAVSSVYADTTSKSKPAEQRDASPSAPVKQDEERTVPHSQPDVPHAGGTEPRNTQQADPQSASSVKGKKDATQKKDSSSSGSSAPKAGPTSRLSADQEQAFKGFDVDGDGAISKAEAAGNETIVKHFDRADRDRDGKLSKAEYAGLEKLQARSQARALASRR